MSTIVSTDVAIIGAGTAGLYALREVRRAGKDFVLIDRGPLGTTCARVGCMPSKVALHAAATWQARQPMQQLGVSGTEQLRIHHDSAWAHVRQLRDQFAGGAANQARKAAGDKLLEGSARFLSPQLLEVQTPSGTIQVQAKAVILAVGSRPVMPAWLQTLAKSSGRVLTTDELFEQTTLPQRVGILGLGAIGLEMGLALARMGIEVVGADLAPQVAGISDPVVAQAATEHLGQELPLWLGEATTVEATANGQALRMRAGQHEAEVDMLLAALGRRPNLDQLNLEATGLTLNERGMPAIDPSTMQVANSPIFVAGDANALRPLMHEAADQGAAAGFNAARLTEQAPVRFAAKVPLGIAFTDPDIVSVGQRWDQLNQAQILVGQALGQGNGRARIINSNSSVLRIYADAQTGRLLGASMLAKGGEHLAHLLAASIARQETAAQALQLPYYHPVLEEMLASALQDIVRQQPAASPYPLGLVVL